MEVRLLGPVEVAGADGSVVAVPGQKLQLLLAALAVERGRVVTPDRLVQILYGDDPPRQPLNSLQVLVSRLRRSLAGAPDAPRIETTDAGYALVNSNGNGTGTDLERFEAMVARARQRLADDPGAAVIDLREALDLVRGEPLAGLPAEGWARAERARFAEAQLAAVEDRIDAELAIGGHGAVVGEIEQLTQRHPLRERLWGQLMLALYRCGRQADALRAFQQARAQLVDELGIEPGAELRRLEAAVLAQDPALDPPAVVRSAVVRPPLGTTTADTTTANTTTADTTTADTTTAGRTAGGSNIGGTIIGGPTTAGATGDSPWQVTQTPSAGNGPTEASVPATGAPTVGAPGDGAPGSDTVTARGADPGTLAGPPAADISEAPPALGGATGATAVSNAPARNAGGPTTATPAPATPTTNTGGPTTPAWSADAAGTAGAEAGGAVSPEESIMGWRAARGNVPRPLTACLGREREMADVLDLVDSHRLVTLVGPGGAGKTRLSFEVAHALAPAARDGVWLVDLATVRDATAVLTAVVRTLRLDEGVLAGTPAPRSIDEVAAALSGRRIVLLVDNCEHVVDEVARLVETLLARCPDLRVLATSRETLGVPGEFLFVVPPLPLDRAVELFLDRMSAAGGPPIGPFDGWRDTVVEICARLDGLPLAVELAAARARHLDLTEMVARLDRRFDLLVEGPRTAQPRQRTLRAVVDWSYELLDDDERRVFERLAAFSGGATLAAAQAVCADGDVDPAAVEAVLGRLVDKSLVGIQRTPDGARFTMLQTLADYAADRLAEHDEHPTVARRHAHWARGVTARIAIGRPEAGQTAQVRAIQADAANLQQAVAWALDHEPLLALELAGNLGWHWFTTMQSGLAWSVLTTTLARQDDDAPDHLVARAQAIAGLAGVMAGHRDQAFALAEAAYPTEQRIGDPQRLGWHCFLRASQHVFSTEAGAAAGWLVQARRWFEEVGDEHGLATVDYQEGVVAGMLGDLAEARRLLTRATETCRRTGSDMTLMAALARLGEVAERDNRPDDSYLAWEELHGLALDAAVPALVSLAASGMAFIRLDAGDAEAATALGEAALSASHEGFSPVIGGYAMAAWGMAQAAFGDHRLGVERIHEAAGLFSRVGYHGGAAECWWRLSQISADEGDNGGAVQCAEQAVECASKGDDMVAREAAQAQLDAARSLAS